jgi:hypothetical protein
VSVLQTVILKSISSDISGVIEYTPSPDCIRLSYNLSREEKDKKTILKLLLLSSQKPANMPMIADTAEFDILHAFGKAKISKAALAYNGYYIDDIDTFCVVEKGKSAPRLVAVGYVNLLWNTGESIKRLFKDEKNNALTRGELLLKSIKKPPKDKNAYLDIIKSLGEYIKNKKKSTAIPIDDYKWYEMEDITAPLNISAYCHLLYVPKVKDAFLKEGCLLLGIKIGGKTALAIKTKGENPFVNAEDCAVKQGDFWVVGVEFKEDGQYFVRIK